MNHTNQRVLITGGATGIGFALAQKFHAAGNQVIIVGRTESTLSKAAALLLGGEMCVADVTLPEHRARLVERYSDITVLVNNAAVQVNTAIADTSAAEIEHELNINFLAPVLLAHAFLPLLRKQPSAAIINVSSALALVPTQSASIYCASKAAIRSFSKTLRWQLERTNVKVFDIVPPLVDTAMTSGRGKGKITPEQLANEFWSGFKSDRYQMQIGKAKLLSLVNRIAPSVAERIMRRGL